MCDAVGRPIRIGTPDGFSLVAYRSAANRWGGTGRVDLALEKNGKGDLTERALDGERVVWVGEREAGVAPNLASLTEASCGAANTTRHTYQRTGEIQTIYDARAVASGTISDPNHRLSYAYDTLGRVVRIEDPDLAGLGYTRTTYSEAGTLAATMNARGQVRSFEHDILGRLTRIDAPPGEDDYRVEYRPTEWQRKRDFSAAYERLHSYDGWGRVAQTRLSVLEPDGPAYWGEGWSGIYYMDFAYDLAGRPVEVTYPESTKVRYEYEGAYLKRVCDLGTAADCSDAGVAEYVSNVGYDDLGRRSSTASDAGTRNFSYDGSLPRLAQDRFDALSGPPSPFFLELNYTAYDELGNLTQMTGSSQPGDIDLNQSFGYHRRNRLSSWTQQGTAYGYGYDDLGNLTQNAGSSQVFANPTRPHAIQSRASGSATYAHDADGNVTSIQAAGSTRYFQFDSASRLVCADSVQGGCALNRIHYDVDGRRVLDDSPTSLRFVAFVEFGEPRRGADRLDSDRDPGLWRTDRVQAIRRRLPDGGQRGDALGRAAGRAGLARRPRPAGPARCAREARRARPGDPAAGLRGRLGGAGGGPGPRPGPRGPRVPGGRGRRSQLLLGAHRPPRHRHGDARRDGRAAGAPDLLSLRRRACLCGLGGLAPAPLRRASRGRGLGAGVHAGAVDGSPVGDVPECGSRRRGLRRPAELQRI